MAIAKVILNGETLMDVTSDTVATNSMLNGVTATKNDGTKATGNIATKTSSDLTASGATVTVPSGYYASQATKSVSSGSATPASTISATGASVSTGTNTLTLSKNVSNTPQVSAGYVSSGTAGNSSVSLTATVTTNPTPTASGDTVTIPAGYYSAQTTKSVSSGTAGTPTATKGSVSNHSVSVTPSVTNTTGYITGGTKTGTAVTVSASELVSGTKNITENGTGVDVTEYASVDVNVQNAELHTVHLGTTPNSGTVFYVINGAYSSSATKYASPDTSFTTEAGNTVYVNVNVDSAKTARIYYNNELVKSSTGSAGYNLTMPKYDIEINTSGSSSAGIDVYITSPTLTINSNGYHNVENYAIVDVQAAPTYTATLITSSGSSSSNYVTYNNNKYYTLGDTFTFSAGDTATFTGSYAGACKRYLDGTLISTDTTYVYTLPACDIEIQLQNYNSPSGQYAIQKITTSTLTITENGSYDVTNYVNVVVNVSS